MGVVADLPAADFGDCLVLQNLLGVHPKQLGHLHFGYYLLLLCVVMVRAFWQLAKLHSVPIDPPRSSVLKLTADLNWLFGPQGRWTLHLLGCCSDPDWYSVYSP
jgi:hypothetical protein